MISTRDYSIIGRGWLDEKKAIKLDSNNLGNSDILATEHNWHYPIIWKVMAPFDSSLPHFELNLVSTRTYSQPKFFFGRSFFLLRLTNPKLTH